MNKEEVLKLVGSIGPFRGWTFDTPDELLAFANACENIGIERAAKENSELRKAAMRVLDAPYAKSGVEFILAMKQLDSIVTGTPTNAISDHKE